jgi:hypothetical protein
MKVYETKKTQHDADLEVWKEETELVAIRHFQLILIVVVIFYQPFFGQVYSLLP